MLGLVPVSRSIVVVALAGFASLALASPAAALLPATWAEVGDAQGPGQPQVLLGDGSVRSIHGSIGGSDILDVFTFRLGEPPDPNTPNPFAAMVAFDDPGASLFLHLLSEVGDEILVGDGSVRLAHLDPGLYHIGISTELLADPPYTVTFLTDNVLFVGPLPVPEPASLGILGLGLAGLAWSRRRAAPDVRSAP